jgi:hypothetical protein
LHLDGSWRRRHLFGDRVGMQHVHLASHLHERLHLGNWQQHVHWKYHTVRRARELVDQLLQPRLQLHVGRLHWNHPDLRATLASHLYDTGLQLFGDRVFVHWHADTLHDHRGRERVPEAAWLLLVVDVDRVHWIGHAVRLDRDAG